MLNKLLGCFANDPHVWDFAKLTIKPKLFLLDSWPENMSVKLTAITATTRLLGLWTMFISCVWDVRKKMVERNDRLLWVFASAWKLFVRMEEIKIVGNLFQVLHRHQETGPQGIQGTSIFWSYWPFSVVFQKCGCRVVSCNLFSASTFSRLFQI